MKLKGVATKVLQKWMLCALKDAKLLNITIDDMIGELERNLGYTERDAVIRSGRY